MKILKGLLLALLAFSYPETVIAAPKPEEKPKPDDKCSHRDISGFSTTLHVIWPEGCTRSKSDSWQLDKRSTVSLICALGEALKKDPGGQKAEGCVWKKDGKISRKAKITLSGNHVYQNSYFVTDGLGGAIARVAQELWVGYASPSDFSVEIIESSGTEKGQRAATVTLESYSDIRDRGDCWDADDRRNVARCLALNGADLSAKILAGKLRH